MVTKPISAIRSNGRANAQRITCSKSKKKKKEILLFSKKTVLKLAHDFACNTFQQQYHKNLMHSDIVTYMFTNKSFV